MAQQTTDEDVDTPSEPELVSIKAMVSLSSVPSNEFNIH